MAKTTVNQLPPIDPVRSLNTRLDYIQNGRIDSLNYVAGGLTGLGEIVFTYHSNGIEGLAERDMDRVGMAIMALGQYVDYLAEAMEGDVIALREQLKVVNEAAA